MARNHLEFYSECTGVACSTYGGEERCIQGSGGERDHLEDQGLDGRILNWILRKWDGGVNDWFDLVPDRSRWRALVNAVMNLRFHKMRGISGLRTD